MPLNNSTINRQVPVPLSVQRLPRLIGLSRAMDLILTGRTVDAQEALQIGLANRVVETGQSREEAEKLAIEISAFPQNCMRSDRAAVYCGYDMEFKKAMEQEFLKGLDVIKSGESILGAKQFETGIGRHGKF